MVQLYIKIIPTLILETEHLRRTYSIYTVTRQIYSLIHYIFIHPNPLCQTLRVDHMSLVDTAVFVLCASFVRHLTTIPDPPAVLTCSKTAYQCFHHLEPRSRLPLLLLLFVVPALLSVPISYHIPWPSVAFLLAFVTYGSAVTSFILMYRLSPFHPLAKYPGPAIAKTSKLWAAYLSAKGDIHRCFKKLHDRYGDVVRVGM